GCSQHPRAVNERTTLLHVDEDGGDAQAGAEQPGAPATPASVLPFPTGALPPPLQQFVNEGAIALSCPPDYLGVPMLVVAGAAIGTTYVLAVKPGWRERPCLWASIVGPPGKVKSPALRAVAGPVHVCQKALMTIWQDVMKVWK